MSSTVDIMTDILFTIDYHSGDIILAMFSSNSEINSRCKLRTQFAYFKVSALGSSGLDEKNITILNDIFFALGHDLSGRFDGGFIAILLESIIVEDNCLDKRLLEIYRI